jgi:DNA-binding beta-propeller fold protein YncE
MRAAKQMAIVLAFSGISMVQAAQFVAVVADTDPDHLATFNTATVESPSPAGNLDGNFIRGIDFTGAGNGHYVAMQSVNDSPAGFFQIRAGVASKVADVPFETSALGDLTYNANQDGMYAALNPPGQPCSLYEVSLAGQFTHVGRIIVKGSGTADISGLAMDPVGGVLYGLDNRTNSLIRIDPANGQAMIVGDGLGMPINFAGAMDFAYDGSGLYFSSNAGKVYEVDPKTGLAGTALGQLPFAVSAMAAVPEPAALALLALGAVLLRRR